MDIIVTDLSINTDDQAQSCDINYRFEIITIGFITDILF